MTMNLCWHCEAASILAQHSPYCSDTCRQRGWALQRAVAEVFGDDEHGITKPLSPEGRAAVKARVPWATDADIDGVYGFRFKYEMVMEEAAINERAAELEKARE